jgi:hypothetical protein
MLPVSDQGTRASATFGLDDLGCPGKVLVGRITPRLPLVQRHGRDDADARFDEADVVDELSHSLLNLF